MKTNSSTLTCKAGTHRPLLIIKDAGFHVEVAGDRLAVSPAAKLSPLWYAFIKEHKQQIIRELREAESRPNRFVYHYKTASGEAGTWITDETPENARKAIAERFPQHEITDISRTGLN